MKEALRRRLTYGNVVGTLALFVALGGTSYAALTITGKNVKNSSLTGVDIRNSSLTTADIKDRSLLRADFKAGQLPAGPQGAKGDKGDKGDPGLNGANGAAGATGSAGATNVTTRLKTQSLAVGENDLTVACLAGERAVGGGGNTPANDPEVTIVASNPFPATNATTPTGWTMRFVVTGIAHTFTTSVVCTSP